MADLSNFWCTNLKNIFYHKIDYKYNKSFKEWLLERPVRGSPTSSPSLEVSVRGLTCRTGRAASTQALSSSENISQCWFHLLDAHQKESQISFPSLPHLIKFRACKIFCLTMNFTTYINSACPLRDTSCCLIYQNKSLDFKKLKKDKRKGI